MTLYPVTLFPRLLKQHNTQETQQGLDTWQSCSWSSGVSHLQEEVAVVLSLLPKVTVLKDSSPLLDAWLLGHTLGINQKTLGSPLDCKEIKPVNPKGNEPWIFTGRADAEAPILWPFDAKSWLTGKDPHAGKDWRQENGGVQRMRWLDSITNSMNMNLSKLGDRGGQRKLAWDDKEWKMTWWLNKLTMGDRTLYLQ